MKKFVVKYQIGEPSGIKHRAKSINVRMDGYKMKKRASLPDEKEGTLRGVRTSDNTLRPFTFADIQMIGVDHPSSPTIPPYLAYILHPRAT